MLDLTEALRDLQDGHDSLRRLDAAADPDAFDPDAFDIVAFRSAFVQTIADVRRVQYALQRAVRTAARQEPGRLRVEAAAAWWAREAAAVDADPVLTWARDAGDRAVDGAGAVVDPPATHRGADLAAADRTASGLLALALAHCEAMYERALRQWG